MALFRRLALCTRHQHYCLHVHHLQNRDYPMYHSLTYNHGKCSKYGHFSECVPPKRSEGVLQFRLPSAPQRYNTPDKVKRRSPLESPCKWESVPILYGEIQKSTQKQKCVVQSALKNLYANVISKS